MRRPATDGSCSSVARRGRERHRWSRRSARRRGRLRRIGALPAEELALELAGEWSRAAEAWERIGRPYARARARRRRGHSRSAQCTGRTAATRRQAGDRHRAAQSAPARRSRVAARCSPEHPGKQRGSDRPRNRSARAGRSGVTQRRDRRAVNLAEKTVDHHVSAILRKLGVRNRGETTAEAARLGLQTGDYAAGGSGS